MSTQSIDLSAVKNMNFNGTEIKTMNLNGSEIWGKIEASAFNTTFYIPIRQSDVSIRNYSTAYVSGTERMMVFEVQRVLSVSAIDMLVPLSNSLLIKATAGGVLELYSSDNSFIGSVTESVSGATDSTFMNYMTSSWGTAGRDQVLYQGRTSMGTVAGYVNPGGGNADINTLLSLSDPNNQLFFIRDAYFEDSTSFYPAHERFNNISSDSGTATVATLSKIAVNDGDGWVINEANNHLIKTESAVCYRGIYGGFYYGSYGSNGENKKVKRSFYIDGDNIKMHTAQNITNNIGGSVCSYAGQVHSGAGNLSNPTSSTELASIIDLETTTASYFTALN
jgi:hypothetical protein